MQGFFVVLVVGAIIWSLVRFAKKAEQQALKAKLEAAARERLSRLPGAMGEATTARTAQRAPAGTRREQRMTPTGSYKGHAYAITYATENDWPVTSVRLTMRRPLPAGVAVHPRGAAPWSSGRISGKTAGTGDGGFDKRFVVRAERPADLRFLGDEVRGVLVAAIDAHPGLWLGHDGVVCVERGHLRDSDRLGTLLDELVALALLVGGAVESGAGVAKSRRETPAKQQAPEREAPATFRAEASAGDPGDVQAFIRACFDRRVAAYEVNRRLKQEWEGRRVSGRGTVVSRLPLGGHDFDFAELAGYRVELQVKGPEEVAPLVRVRLQVEESRRAEVERLEPGREVRFDGQLLSANTLLSTLQLVSASVAHA
jgi:hypothetical protein